MMIHTLGKFTEMNVDTHELLNTGTLLLVVKLRGLLKIL